MSKIKKFQIASAIFACLLGSLLHFTYDLSNQNQFVAAFSAVNESTWEHLKLVFFPMLITTIVGFFLFKDEYSNFLCSKTIGIIVAITFIVVFFYTYTGIIGKSIPIIDIASFFVAVVLGDFVAYLLIINRFRCNNTNAVICLIALLFSFILFTYFTPKIGIFRDPISGKYGIIEK